MQYNERIVQSAKILVTCITIHCMCAMRTLWVHSNWVAFCLIFFFLFWIWLAFLLLLLRKPFTLYCDAFVSIIEQRPSDRKTNVQYIRYSIRLYWSTKSNPMPIEPNSNNQKKNNERMKISLSTINVIDVWSFDNRFMSSGIDSPSMNANLHTCFKFLHGLLFNSSFTIFLFLPLSPIHLKFPITCS